MWAIQPARQQTVNALYPPAVLNFVVVLASPLDAPHHMHTRHSVL